MTLEQVRLFIAIELPEELRLALKRLQQELVQGKHFDVKWVDPQGIHLTLKFLGAVRSDKLGDIVGVMAQATRGVAPFGLVAGNVGAFPNLRQPRVVWVGVGGDVDRLAPLQQGIETGLVPLGFAAETRPFSPHLTVARVRDRASLAERAELGQLIAAARFGAQSIPVTAVNLMRSELTRDGARYTRLHAVALG